MNVGPGCTFGNSCTNEHRKFTEKEWEAAVLVHNKKTGHSKARSKSGDGKGKSKGKFHKRGRSQSRDGGKNSRKTSAHSAASAKPDQAGGDTGWFHLAEGYQGKLKGKWVPRFCYDYAGSNGAKCGYNEKHGKGKCRYKHMLFSELEKIARDAPP